MNILTIFLLSYFTYEQCLRNVDSFEIADADILNDTCQGLVAVEPVIYYWYLKLRIGTADRNFSLSKGNNRTMLKSDYMLGARKQLHLTATGALKSLEKNMMRSMGKFRTVPGRKFVSMVGNLFDTLEIFLTELLEAIPPDELKAKTAVSGMLNQTAKTLEVIDDITKVVDDRELYEQVQIAVLSPIGVAYYRVMEKYPTPKFAGGGWRRTNSSDAELDTEFEEMIANIREICAHPPTTTVTSTKATTTTSTTKTTTTTTTTTTAPQTDPTTEEMTTVTDAPELPTTPAKQPDATTSSSPELSKLFINVALFCGMAFSRFI